MTPEQLELVEGFWPWLRTVAGSMTTPDRADELAQEAWIAVWLGAPKWPGKGSFDGWIRKCAKNRMVSVIRAEKAERRDRRKTDLYGDFPVEIEPATRDTPNLLTYHHPEIAAALNALPEQDREYIVQRFWCGQTGGKRHTPASNRWRYIKPKLAESLAHLEAVA